MKVVAFVPKPSELQVVVVEGTREQFDVTFHEAWPVEDARIAAYVSIRKRVVERVKTWAPDAVCIAAFEPAALQHGAKATMFETAELRGVAAEAASTACPATEFRTAAKVSNTIGDRKKAEYLSDEGFWKQLPRALPKAFRPAVLIALSYMGDSE